MILQSQHLLLEAIKSSLFQEEFFLSSDSDCNELLMEAKAQTVTGLISSVLPFRNDLSKPVKAMYMRILYEQNNLIKCFESAGIPCVIIKGSAAAIYYPKPYLRTMGDIDILVDRDKISDSMELLESNGYIYDHGKEEDNSISDDTRELAYTKNGIIIELHQRFGSPGFDVDDILEAAIERRIFSVLNGYRFPVLPNLENGLVLIGHINLHLQSNTLGLRQIIDWEMYLNYMKDFPEWSKQFISLVDKTGLLQLAAYVTRMCNKYLGLSYEVDFGVELDDSTVDGLLEVVMNDGNFGRRIYVDKTFEEKQIIGVSYVIKRDGFFRYFVNVGIDKCLFFKKHPSLKFFAFIYGIFRQSLIGIKTFFKVKSVGTKIGDGRKMYSVHSNRHDLYKKLGVRTEQK